MKDNMRIGVVNMQAFSGEKKKNLEAMFFYIKEAAAQKVDMLILPELCLQGYDLFVDEAISQEEKIAVAESIDGDSCKAIQEMALHTKQYIVFGMAELAADEKTLYNTAVAVSPTGEKWAYRKIHPFAKENLSFAKGEQPLLLDTPWGPVGVGICYDTYQFPELMRYYAYHGARLYVNPTAVSEEVDKQGSREAFLRYYKPTLEYGVLANTIYIASANLVGKDTFNTFGGGSVIIGPKQSDFYETDVCLYGGGYDCIEAGLFVADVDVSLATRQIFLPNPYAQGEPDFRPEIYKNLY